MMFTTNPECSACTDDPDGRHHYHCGTCGAGPFNAYLSGHQCPARSRTAQTDLEWQRRQEGS